jgi:hypothetical protein
MKLLFSSSDHAEVERFRKTLAGAGIGCEIRQEPASPNMLGIASYPELWIQDDSDFRAASMLFATRGRAG